MRFANARNLPPSKVLRLPWKRWGETDTMLAMAADLHDRMVCSCGCNQWRADAHDPATANRWTVDEDICYARRAISDHVKAVELGPDAVLRVRLLPEGTSSAADEYADLLARFPHLRKSKDEPYRPADDDGHHGEEREQ